MYKRNIDARLRNHCCRKKARAITYSESVFLALVILEQIFLSAIICTWD